MSTFDLKKPKYDQHFFLGRFKAMVDVADPRCLAPKTFFGISLPESQQILEDYKAGVKGVPDEKLWLARKIKESAIHPDTQEVIPAPFRMSGFAVFNTPILVGMLVPNLSIPMSIFWHSANQTHNACINYANRNASQPTPISKLLQGYAGALISSVSIAVGLGQVVNRLPVSAAMKGTLGRFVPFPAVATAAVLNITLMRRTELTNGIEIYDETGKTHGSSQIAAKEGLINTAKTRVILPMPLLVIPPVIMMGLEKNFLKRFPKMYLPTQAALCTAAFIVGLPMAIAVFPQEGKIQASDVEDRFKGAKDNNGNEVETFYYNKGL